jgi:hypothetical protein
VIDIIEKFDSLETVIAGYWKARIDGYYDSDCYKALDAKMNTMQDCADLVPMASKWNDWMSNVRFPIVKERQLLRRAITAANYRNADLASCSPMGSTPYTNAAQAETVLNLNIANIRFRFKTLKPCIDTASKFGTAVTFTYWKKTGKPEMKTVYNEKTGQYSRKKEASGYENAYSCQIGLRDYFQNPDIADPEESDFQGHRRRVHLSELVPMLDDPLYIRENVEKALELARQGKTAQYCNSKSADSSEFDEKRHYVDVYRIEGSVNIKENEDDDTNYVTEMIGDTIIRLTREDYDRNMRSYAVVSYDKRHDRWYGTSDSEYVVTHENYLNTIMGMSLDNAMRSLQQYVFFDKGKISATDINNVGRNNGFVPVDANNIPISQLVSAFSPGSVNMDNVQYAVNAVQQSIQQMSTKVDLSRKPNEGGLNNNTATAANIVAGQSDVLESDILDNFNEGIISTFYKQLYMLQQFLPDVFYVRPDPKQDERDVQKYLILGDMNIAIQSSMQKNKQGELQRLQNLVTWWLNISQAPALQQLAINIRPLIKEIWNKAEVPSDDIMPSDEKAQQMQQMQQQQAPQAQGAGMPQMPQQPPPQAGAMVPGLQPGALA